MGGGGRFETNEFFLDKKKNKFELDLIAQSVWSEGVLLCYIIPVYLIPDIYGNTGDCLS